MLLGGVDPRAGRLEAARFVVQESRRAIEVKRCETQLAAFTQPGFDEIAAVVVQAHWYQVPIDHDIATFHSTGADVTWCIVEFGIGEQRADLDQIFNISAEYFQKLGLHPAIVHVGPWINVDPGAVLIAAQDGNPVFRVEPPFRQVG